MHRKEAYPLITTLCLIAVLIGPVWSHRHRHSANGDDEVAFVGFHNVATMPYNLSDNTATTFDIDFHDNHGPRIYLVGGCDAAQQCSNVDETVNNAMFCQCPSVTNRCMYFTPETETWHTTCSSAPTPRYRHMAAKVGNYLYVAGGRTQSDDSIITTVERYDPFLDEWTNPFNWTNAASDGAAFSRGDLLYLVGGYDAVYTPLSNLTVINTITNLVSDLPGMNVSRGDLAAIAANENEVFVVGGFNEDFCIGPLDVVEVYSLNTSSWRTVAPLNHSRADLVLGVLGKAVFAVGGETRTKGDLTCSYSDAVNLVERHLLRSNTWDGEENIPNNLFRFSGTSYRSRGKNKDFVTAIYLFGGQSDFDKRTMTFPLRGSTIKYIPASTRSRNKALSSSTIAGVIIGGFVAGLIIILIFLGYLEHKRRNYGKVPASDASLQSASSFSSKANLSGAPTHFERVDWQGTLPSSYSTRSYFVAKFGKNNINSSNDNISSKSYAAETSVGYKSRAIEADTTFSYSTKNSFTGGVQTRADGKKAISHAPKPRPPVPSLELTTIPPNKCNITSADIVT